MESAKTGEPEGRSGHPRKGKRDDILDVTSTEETLGKPVLSDEKNQKMTYVAYEGLEKAKEEVAALSGQAIAQMNSLVVKNEFLTELLRYLIAREK